MKLTYRLNVDKFNLYVNFIKITLKEILNDKIALIFDIMTL